MADDLQVCKIQQVELQAHAYVLEHTQYFSDTDFECNLIGSLVPHKVRHRRVMPGSLRQHKSVCFLSLAR